MLDVAIGADRRYYGGMVKYYGGDKLSAAQAAKHLGISRWKFYRLVDAGIIHRQVDEPYVQGYYLLDEVDAYKRKLDEANRANKARRTREPDAN